MGWRRTMHTAWSTSWDAWLRANKKLPYKLTSSLSTLAPATYLVPACATLSMAGATIHENESGLRIPRNFNQECSEANTIQRRIPLSYWCNDPTSMVSCSAVRFDSISCFDSVLFHN
jgi:hypothetical protein